MTGQRNDHSVAGGAGIPAVSEAYTEALREARETLLSEQFRSLQPREEAARRFEAFRKADEKNEGNAGELFTAVRKMLVSGLEDFRAEYEKNPALFSYPFSTPEDAQKALASVAQSIDRLMTRRALDGRFLELLNSHFELYKSSAKYMERLVKNRLREIGSEDLIAPGASTGLLIMRQFIKQFGDGYIDYKQKNGKTKKRKICGKDRGKNEKRSADDYSCDELNKICESKYHGSFAEMAKGLTEEEFQRLLTLSEEEACNFAKVADWFSKGKFGKQGKTREYIYVFAIAFEMDAPEIIRKALGTKDKADKWGDINQRLFFDFYTDNLVNMRTDADELFIDGYGINWKNFEEVIFIYYISKPDMAANMKLYKALQTIRDCHKGGATPEQVRHQPLEQQLEQEGTSFLRSENYLKIVFGLDEEAFEEYVKNNYLCKTDDGSNGAAVLYAAERRTAAAACDSLTLAGHQVEEAQLVSLDLEPTAEAGQYRLVPGDENIVVSVKAAFADCVARFMDRYIDGEWAKGLPDISRAGLLSALSYFIVANPDLRVDGSTDGLDRFYNYFCSDVTVRININEKTEDLNGANEILHRCGYCEVNDKSIYDMLIIYVTYRSCADQDYERD